MKNLDELANSVNLLTSSVLPKTEEGLDWRRQYKNAESRYNLGLISDEEYERILNVVKNKIEGFLVEKEISPEKGLRYFWFSWSCEMSGTKGIVICSAYLSQREHPSISQLREIAANTGPKSSNIALVSLTEFKDEADFKAFTSS